MKCTIIDYGTGNLQSVQNAFEHLGHTVIRSAETKHINSTDIVVFPGQGAFGPAINELNNRKLTTILRNYIASKRPFIGICLGFQLLFESSTEAKNIPGLGCFEGHFKRFENSTLSVPHMGWNAIQANNTNTVLDQFNNERFYFVHSYYLPETPHTNFASTDYGITFISALANKTQLITQFHPEKSGESGLSLLDTFLREL